MNPIQTVPSDHNGPSFMNHKAGLPSFEGIKSKIASGEIDTEKLKSKIADQFGDDIANSVFEQDGTINFDKLSELPKKRSNEKVSPSEHLDSGSVQGKFDIEKFKVNIKNQFGEEAASEIIGEDGSINFNKLLELKSDQENETFYNSAGASIEEELSKLINFLV